MRNIFSEISSEINSVIFLKISRKFLPTFLFFLFFVQIPSVTHLEFFSKFIWKFSPKNSFGNLLKSSFGNTTENFPGNFLALLEITSALYSEIPHAAFWKLLRSFFEDLFRKSYENLQLFMFFQCKVLQRFRMVIH